MIHWTLRDNAAHDEHIVFLFMQTLSDLGLTPNMTFTREITPQSWGMDNKGITIWKK